MELSRAVCRVLAELRSWNPLPRMRRVSKTCKVHFHRLSEPSLGDSVILKLLPMRLRILDVLPMSFARPETDSQNPGCPSDRHKVSTPLSCRFFESWIQQTSPIHRKRSSTRRLIIERKAEVKPPVKGDGLLPTLKDKSHVFFLVFDFPL